MPAELRIFGIRHHGPGSARSLKRALESYVPDAILVEGPPDADDVLQLAAHEEMKPPVALLVYVPDQPQHAVFYPFAVFSPEWIAIQHGLQRKSAIQFMDLPQAHRLIRDDAKSGEEPIASDESAEPVAPDPVRLDPLGQLAEIAGFSDSERWWDYVVESRRDSHAQVFEAIADAMATLRETDRQDDLPRLEAQREAYMRKTIRAAMQRYERIAVICGAWHAPALREPNAKGLVSADNAVLKGLPKVKTAVAWTPWSYDRLSFRSGYGAGVESPAYYHLLYTHDRFPAVHWMTQVARLMRKQDLDASSAHVIEAVRLADTLAALRNRPLAGLQELDEAVLAVMCFGNDAPMQLIRRKLVIGDRLGQIPDEAPVAPLQQDLARQQKRLRLPVSADERDYDLDLRKELDLDRSHLLHRLCLLGVRWGDKRDQRGKKGTFHEFWRVKWSPEFIVNLIEASRWGNTIAEAATARTLQAATEANSLSVLAEHLDHALLADLPDAVSALMLAFQNQAAQSSDCLQLANALPALARITRYGNVRKTDATLVLEVINGLIERICVGLPLACSSLNDDAAHDMFGRIVEVNDAINLLQRDDHKLAWHAALSQIADHDTIHGMVSGRALRILHDAGARAKDVVASRFSMALSTANEPSRAAAWIEGFLSGSGMLLIHDPSIWALLDEWVVSLSADHFTAVLPLLRRTFSTFPAPERRQMGERVKRGAAAHTVRQSVADFDFDRAALVLPVLAKILGVEEEPA